MTKWLRMNEWMNQKRKEKINEEKDEIEWRNKYVWMNEWLNDWMNEWLNKWIHT